MANVHAIKADKTKKPAKKNSNFVGMGYSLNGVQDKKIKKAAKTCHKKKILTGLPTMSDSASSSRSAKTTKHEDDSEDDAYIEPANAMVEEEDEENPVEYKSMKHADTKEVKILIKEALSMKKGEVYGRLRSSNKYATKYGEGRVLGGGEVTD